MSSRRISTGSLVSLTVALTAIGIGILLSPIATQTGIFRHVPLLHPSLIGLVPAVTPRDQWRYTFEQFRNVDLRGQSALITGANSGLGLSVAKMLSERGAAVTLGCRNPQRCFQACDAIRADANYSGAPISPLMIDVSS